MALTEHRDPKGTGAHQADTAGVRRGSPLNLPNLITFSRLLLAILLFWLIDLGQHWLIACAIFVFAAATDAIDGYIARRYGLVTVVGRILDPFVDKVIVGGAFVFLVPQPESGVNAWMAMIVIGREMFITSLRSFLESKGQDFSATTSGKIKMVLQCVAIAASLLYLEYGRDAGSHETLAAGRDLLLWSAVAVTIYSGVAYVMRAVQLFRSA
jgi:CDP-diacylglycerol---glycerol-3-phosphate 3-phosphatidyltransferase